MSKRVHSGDKLNQLLYLTGLMGLQEGTYLYKTKFLTLRQISFFYHKIPKPFMGSLNSTLRCKEAIIVSLRLAFDQY